MDDPVSGKKAEPVEVVDTAVLRIRKEEKYALI